MNDYYELNSLTRIDYFLNELTIDQINMIRVNISKIITVGIFGIDE